MNWTDATSTAGGSPIATHNSASRCGHATGWRVPMRRELLSIVHHGAFSPAIDTNYFPGTQAWYWTNDSYPPDLAVAWSVHFGNGDSYANGKAFTYRVRLVRSGQ